MASKIILEEGTERERIKVTYDVPTNGRVTRKRKSKTFPPGTPKKVIDRFVREVEQELEKGEFLDYTKRTFSDLGDEYFEKYVRFLSPITLQGYRHMYQTPSYGLRAFFGDVRLERITTALVQDYINLLDDRNLSPKSIKNRVMLLHAIIGKGIKLNYLKRGYNPVEEVELPKLKKKKIEAYSEDEIRELLEAVDRDGTLNLKLIIYLMLGTGVRKGELCAITFDSINLEKRELYINANVVDVDGKLYIKEPKTAAGVRTIALPETVIAVIKEAMLDYKKRKLKTTNFVDSGYLMTKPNGEQLYPDTVYNIHRRFMMSHPELRYLSLHKLRHTFASISISHNVDVKTLQETLGHSNASVTLDTYSHGYFGNKMKQADLLDDTIFSKNKSAM